jgi:hypothetical protein
MDQAPSQPETLPGTLPRGLACLHCHYDLTGLNWGARCPECGYPAPSTWPTISLIEAHPAFISHLHDRFRDLWNLDAAIAGSLLLLAGCWLASMYGLFNLPRWDLALAITMMAVYVVLLVCAIMLPIALLRMSRKHRNARKDLDYPHRKVIARSFIFAVGPLFFLVLASPLILATGSGAMCILIVALVVSAVAALCLIINTFEHATATIERTGNDPRWTSAQRIFGVTMAVWPVVGLAIGSTLGWQGVGLAALVFVALLCITHALHMRRAQRYVHQTFRTRFPKPPKKRGRTSRPTSP